uniref:PH domain-containing protein n=1 Tax=Panagrolaimus superbus TaxID=310955 RepID=A0A914YED9_9BILA
MSRSTPLMSPLREKNNERSSLKFWQSKYNKSFYVVLCIHRSKIPFLEFYEENHGHSAFIDHQPVKVVDLIGVEDIKICPKNDHRFIISFEEADRKAIKLLAANYELACYWIDEMKISLTMINALKGPTYQIPEHENYFGALQSQESLDEHSPESSSSHRQQTNSNGQQLVLPRRAKIPKSMEEVLEEVKIRQQQANVFKQS